MYARMLNALYGSNLKPIEGYEGSTAGMLAKAGSLAMRTTGSMFPQPQACVRQALMWLVPRALM